MSTFCHGVASAQSLDKSAEIVDIKGLDITSLPKTGILNYEHKSDVPGQICGKILTAKKIFTKEDCSNEHELYFWNKCKNPFVYITAELLDDYCQSGKDAAGLFRYDHDKKDQNSHSILGFSVEGSEIPNTRKGQVITRSIARKVTLTAAPCNQQCVAELLVNTPKSQVKDDFESIFKSDDEAITLFKSGEGEKIYEQYLAKKEDGSHGTEIGKTKSGKQIWSHGHPDSYDFDPSEHKEAAEHHRHAAVTANDSESADNHIQRMAAHNGASIGLKKARVDEGKSPEDKASARAERHHRFSQVNTKAGELMLKPTSERRKQLESGSPGKPGEKIAGNLNPDSTKKRNVGVNRPAASYPKESGVSLAGANVRSGHLNIARTIASNTLRNLKEMPKPKLDKSETSCELHKNINTPVRRSAGKVGDWNASIGEHKQLGTVATISHPQHGIVTVHKDPASSKFHVKHNGGLAGMKGQKGIFDNAGDAMTHAKNYAKGVSAGKVGGRRMANTPSDPHAPKPDLKKALEAGSTNAAPSTLVNGAAYQRESLGSRQATTGAEDHGFQATKKKDWNKRAKEEYERWPQRDAFEKFMKARMPHLADGEIRAIGRVVSLKKSLDFEKSLKNLVSLNKAIDMKKSEPALSPSDNKKMTELKKHPKIAGIHAEKEGDSETGIRFWASYNKHHHHDNPGQHTTWSDSLEGIKSDADLAKPCGCKDCGPKKVNKAEEAPKSEPKMGEELVHEGHAYKEIQHPQTPKDHKAFNVKDPSGKEDTYFARNHADMANQIKLMARRNASR